MSETVRHAVFIEPEGALRDMVIAWKARVSRQWPGAAYLTHPPHSTMWVGYVHDGDLVRGALKNAAAQVPAFAISIQSPRVFYDDVLAGGGQTCAFAATLVASLTRLQQLFCDALRVHRSASIDADLPPPLRRAPFLESWRQYGFPFVGPHWIPHFTVASLPVRRDDPVVAEFLRSAPTWEMTLYGVSWWRIARERHERLAWLPLAPSPPT